MQFKEYGADNKDVIILLHGGGLAPWNYHEEATFLSKQFHIIIPILDGHNGSDRDFSSIEENARFLIEFIDDKYGGQVLLIGGLSLGGQILVEMLSQRKNICKFAIIESALVLPMRITSMIIKPMFSLFYPLVKMRWFAKLQFDSLHIKSSYFDEYYLDSSEIRKDNMIAFLMANASYKIKSSLSECQAKTLVLVGSKESTIMKKSAAILNLQMKDSSMEILQGYYHGDLSLNHSNIYIEKLFRLIRDK